MDNLLEWLRDSAWQGVGVLVSILLFVVPALIQWIRHRQQALHSTAVPPPKTRDLIRSLQPHIDERRKNTLSHAAYPPSLTLIPDAVRPAWQQGYLERPLQARPLTWQDLQPGRLTTVTAAHQPPPTATVH